MWDRLLLPPLFGAPVARRSIERFVIRCLCGGLLRIPEYDECLKYLLRNFVEYHRQCLFISLFLSFLCLQPRQLPAHHLKFVPEGVPVINTKDVGAEP